MDSLFMHHPETLEPVRIDLRLPLQRYQVGAPRPDREPPFELLGLFVQRGGAGAWQPCRPAERAVLEPLLPEIVCLQAHARQWSDLPFHQLYRDKKAV